MATVGSGGKASDAQPAQQRTPLPNNDARALEQLLRTRGIKAVYQPLVDLAQRQVVGYDALARGPAGSDLELPGRLFETARDMGRVDELEMSCRAAALRGALEADLGSWLTLFMTVEPEVVGNPIPQDVEQLLRTAEQRLRVVLEISERALAVRPGDLMRLVDWAHERYWGIALDDIGANPLSLALMPFLNPDVVKLDLRLIQRLPPFEAAHVVKAVLAHVERTDATILAEGIETEQHLELALTLGATLGQGWLFGRPGPLPRGGRASRTTVRLTQSKRGASTDATPFEVLARVQTPRSARPGLLRALLEHMEAEASGLADTPVVLSSFPSPELFTSDVAQRYSQLAARGALVAAFVPTLGTAPAPGVRGGEVQTGDALAREWSVLVVGPFFAGAVVARRAAEQHGEARFDFMVSYDRHLVLDAARALMARVEPEPADTKHLE